MKINGPITPQRSAWRLTAVPAPHCPVFGRDVTADVAIIGGGYAGLNAAIRCNELGLKAVVLEAEDPGFGGSGRNGGQVIPGLKFDPNTLLEMFGEKHGRPLIDFAGNAPDRTFDTIRRYGMQCDAEQNGWLQPATNQATADKILKRAAAWRDMCDVPVRLLDAQMTFAATGTRLFSSAWIDPRGGQLQPLSYSRELARVAMDGGSEVFQHSPASKISRTGATWTVRCNGHDLKARAVLVCTNGYSGGLIRGLAESLVPASSIICGTAPLPDDLRRTILPSGLPLSDARRLLTYLRFDPAGRLLIGARGSFNLKEPESYFRRLRRAAVAMFPQLGGIAWEAAWGGRFALTADQLPHVHNPEPGLYAAVGCNGRGVAMLSQMGRLLSDLADGMAAEDAPIPLGKVKPIPFHRFRRFGLEAVTLWYRALDQTGR
ncbi:NAD(P)/FAD-dependent oxidoreductase [Roseovarius sp.]|uniref:NAD(P)/FAD-dependent oxidoreductase n=1 Tax=Roseovarius sp. TaxID=1486281 RepID=UPI003B5A455D